MARKKRKISIRKILQVFVTIVATAGCVVAMVSASRIEDSKKLASIAVHIKNDKKYHFVEQQEILDLAIHSRNVDVEHTPVSRLDLHGMEDVIRKNHWVSDAQVYVDNARVLHIYVTQRIPIARVFQQDGKSYYMDTTMSIMPLSGSYIYYTTVVTNVPQLSNDSMSWALRHSIVSLVRHIQSDSFWSAQVSQVIVDSTGGFELMPTIGEQRILFGGATDMKEKFGNIFTFYKNVLNRIGWDKYETLDVRYKDQVVARPALPYNGPVDKAVTNMNWINSIVETEAANDAKDSVKAVAEKVSKAIENKKKEPAKKAPPVILSKSAIKANAAAKNNKNKVADVKKKTAAKQVDKNKHKQNEKDKNKKPVAQKPAKAANKKPH